MEYSDTAAASQAKPVVTMLTDALFRDFASGYEFTTPEQLRRDVEAWVSGLTAQMENESDRTYAAMAVHMIRKNSGWITVLAGRLTRRLAQ